jgi:hypothetical protein
MRISRTWGRVAGGAAIAAAAVMIVSSERAEAKPRRAGGAAPKMTDIDVGDFAGVAQNHIINMRFTQPIDPGTVSPATIQVRVQNAKGTGYSIQVPGTFQVAGSVVRFYPRLPTHLRDPADPNGGFYQPGTPRDDANANAGFQPLKNHQITIIGNPNIGAVKSTAGKPLNRTYQARFTTSPETPKSEAFTIDTYSDAPPPGFEFSNPPDKVASAADQYARHGGTTDVPSAIAVTLFGNKVPISPATVRQAGNVILTMLARKGDTSLRKPMQGTTYIEQNFDTMRMVFQPRFPLPDLSEYALKVTKNVKDLTETYDFKNNAERLRVRDIYEFMVSARTENPGMAWEDLPDPPVELIYDWPADPEARGVLKKNVLTLGDTYPDEIDPRVMVLFSTQDEPVTHAQLTVNFLQNEGYFDPVRSTAEWDQSLAGVANGVFTFAGGSGVDGPFNPAVNTTLSADTYAQNTINWRKVNILPNVIVTITGTRPALIKCLDFQLEGQIRADGQVGTDNPNVNYSQTFSNPTSVHAGGLGGPGGGKGGGSSTTFSPTSLGGTPAVGGTGIVGNDANGSLASAQDGGRGGLGGTQASGTGAYSEGGGGGGGGARTAGTAGAAGTGYYPSWSGSGGNPGVGALGNDDVTPFVGGAGGGAGGNGGYVYYTWGDGGGGGGGGGGAVMVQTSSTLTIGTAGAIRARGGAGGRGTGYKSGWSAGPGGGGGGGTLLLRSSRGFNIANPAAALDVSGGAGGTQTGTYTAPYGGSGGTGFIRLEDPNGGISVPGATAGVYNPVGAGVPSYVYSKWIDVGVDNPKFTNFTAGDFSINAGNDAILIEEQLAIEDPGQFGVPYTKAIDANENSTNVNQVSQWLPVRLLDKTPLGNAFNVPGNTSTDVIFPIESKTAGKNYKFLRLRITFQLDSTQTAQSPLPFVDQVIVHFDFNF